MAPVLTKGLSRLSRDSLLDLCLKWTESQSCAPYLASNRNLLESEEEDYLHEPARDIDGLEDFYNSLKGDSTRSENSHTLSKRDIIDRIVDGDWRRGLTYYQHATIDFAYLQQNDSALRWSALKLVPLNENINNSFQDVHTDHHSPKRRKIMKPQKDPHRGQLHYPRISPASFLQSLRSQISPLVKAHYHLHRLPAPAKLTVLRLHIVPNTPFAPLNGNVPRTPKTAVDAGRVMYIGLPDSCPYVYVSLAGSVEPKQRRSASRSDTAIVDIAATKRIILEAIPKAFSKPQQRWALQKTKLTARSLASICKLRGNERPGTSGGAYAAFGMDNNEAANRKRKPRDGVDPILDENHPPRSISRMESSPLDIEAPLSRKIATAHELQVEQRFGPMDRSSHAPLDRVHVQIDDVSCHGRLVPRSKTPLRSNPQSRKRFRMTEIEDSQVEDDDDHDDEHECAPMGMTLVGSDVFKGLKLFALQHPDMVDLDRMPAWMTGEVGVTQLTV